MSSEYTIDIQLTELGFPDILQPRDTSVTETTSSTDSFNHCSTSRSTPRKRTRVIRNRKEADAAKHTSNTGSTTVVCLPSPPPETTPCQRLDPSPRPRDEQPVNGAAESSTVEEPTAEAQTTDTPQRAEECGEKAEEDSAQEVSMEELQNVEEEDSDDSDVSDVYEEEELEEEEDDGEGEEGPNNELGDFHCNVCDLLLSSKFKLQDHMNLHTGARPYCCAECGKRFCHIYNYRVHLRTHAQAKVERLMCRICLRGFASQGDLNKHLSKTHFEDKFYECDLCKRVFTSLKKCQYHVQTRRCMLTVVCDRCGCNFSSSTSLARHRKKTCHYFFKCMDCTETFKKKNALLKHSYSHLGLLPYTCIRCRCHFRQVREYLKHKCDLERIHCVACLREFLGQEDFQQHKKDTGCWGNQEPNKMADEIRCLECGERFDSSDELKKHAGAHQRVLKCAECGKGFRSALLLMSHMGGHAGKSPCLCQSCGLGFPHQQNYDSHLKTCGQKPPPATAPKKKPTLKIPSPVTKKLCTKPDSSNAARKVIKPPAAAAAAAAAAAVNPSAPVNDSSSSRLVTEGASAGSGPSDGLWSLTLNKETPPGVKLVVLVPVCPSQANGLPLPSAIPQTLPMQALSHLAPSTGLSNRHLGLNAALGLSLNAPMDLLTGIPQHFEAPLDLSKKTNPSKPAVTNIPSLAVKNEPDEFEISGQRNHTERQESKNYDSKVVVQIKTEAYCPTLNCRPEKEIKMEVSNPACAQTEK